MTTTWFLCWLILLLGLSGWWCDCCGEPQPDCAYCSTQDTTISVTIGGFTDNGYCACTNFNMTYVLPLESTPPYDLCVYRTSGPTFACDNWPCWGNVSSAVYASAGVGLGGNYYWFVSLSVTYSCPQFVTMGQSWQWNSGAATPFDCTATRTLTRSAIPTDAVCDGWSNTTCQIN